MKREKAESANNIWNKEGFLMCGLGEKNKIIARIKYFRKCCRWSQQRIARGYADCDKWNMCRYLQNLIPDMLQDLRDKRHGSPGFLGEKLQTEKELEENRKRGGGGTVHFMDELPEYKEISHRYFAEEKKIEEYRNASKDEAMDMLKEYFFSLWD